MYRSKVDRDPEQLDVLRVEGEGGAHPRVAGVPLLRDRQHAARADPSARAGSGRPSALVPRARLPAGQRARLLRGARLRQGAPARRRGRTSRCSSPGCPSPSGSSSSTAASRRRRSTACTRSRTSIAPSRVRGPAARATVGRPGRAASARNAPRRPGLECEVAAADALPGADRRSRRARADPPGRALDGRVPARVRPADGRARTHRRGVRAPAHDGARNGRRRDHDVPRDGSHARPSWPSSRAGYTVSRPARSRTWSEQDPQLAGDAPPRVRQAALPAAHRLDADDGGARSTEPHRGRGSSATPAATPRSTSRSSRRRRRGSLPRRTRATRA